MKFEEMTDLEKRIINTDFLIRKHEEGLQIIRDSHVAFMVELTLESEINKLKEYYKSLVETYDGYADVLIAGYLSGGA